MIVGDDNYALFGWVVGIYRVSSSYAPINIIISFLMDLDPKFLCRHVVIPTLIYKSGGILMCPTCTVQHLCECRGTTHVSILEFLTQTPFKTNNKRVVKIQT